MTDDDGAFIALLEDMIAAWTEVPAPPAVQLPDYAVASVSNLGAVAVVWGWTSRCVRLAETALLLHQQGYGHEAAPIMRSLIEHAIAIPWVVDRRGVAFQSLSRGRVRHFEKVDKAQQTGWPLSAEAAARLRRAMVDETDADTKSEDVNLHVFERAVAYNLGKLYQAWLIENAETHACLLSAEPYFEVHPEDRRATLLRVPRETPPMMPHRIIVALHQAYLGYAAMHPGALDQRLNEWDERFTALMHP